MSHIQLSYLRFCRTVQLFGENHGQQRVDRLEISSVMLQSAASAPTLCLASPRRARHVPPPWCPCEAGPHHLEARADWSPSPLSPRNESLSLPTLAAPALANRTHADCLAVRCMSLYRAHPPRFGRRTAELKRAFP
jgi:hypothetical protein